ncbi:hypothetical protein [Desulfovirgula thermocuniculi]|uniref:hypothetical protein n=1 Tax=Desulfovirgula thermocuniculi TaxID=348842 RepID=UPI0003FDB10D|nr:hypothetical protein [Desulfovirgula thermocuniculi]
MRENEVLRHPIGFYRMKAELFEVAIKASKLLGPDSVWPAHGLSRLTGYLPGRAVLGVVGYRVRWECPSCGGTSSTLLRPEVCGVTAWEWPWPYAEPELVPVDDRDGRRARGTVKIFFLDCAKLREAKLAPAVAFEGKVFPCGCRGEDGGDTEGEAGRFSSFFLLVPRKGGMVEKRGVDFDRYLEACRLAAERIPEVAVARRAPLPGSPDGRESGGNG